MQYIITVSTLIKGVILVVMVLLVGYVARQVNILRDTWQYIVRPFLIGTVPVINLLLLLLLLPERVKKPLEVEESTIGGAAAAAWRVE